MYLLEILGKQEGFSENEKRIANFILGNPEKITRINIGDFSKMASVSESSIVRFCKSIGVKGFKDFKLELSKELVVNKNKDFNIVKKNNNEKLSLDDVFYNSLNLDRIAVEQLVNTLDLKNIAKVIDLLIKKERIVCYGVGASVVVAEDLWHKMTKLGIQANFNKDFHQMLSVVLNMKKGDLFFVISTTGQTEEIIDMAKVAKEQGAIVISITTLQKSKLAKISNINLFTPLLEEYFRVGNMATRISQLVIVDIIYMGLYEAMNGESTEKLYALRNTIKRFRE